MERECSLQSYSRSWKGKRPSQAPSISGNVTGTRAGTRELIYLGLHITWSLQTRGPLSWLLVPLLHNGHLVGRGEASRQSLLQSPVLGRHGSKQRGAVGWGAEPERGRQVHNYLWFGYMQLTWHPALWDPVCFTDQQTQSLLSSPVPLKQTGSTHPHTLSLSLSHAHMHSHTQTHPHKHTLTHIHPHTHLHSPSHTYTHWHTTYTHLSTEPTEAQT